VVPTLLPASCPGTWDPVGLDFAASARAAFVSFETAGGFPETGPVSSPTSLSNCESMIVKVAITQFLTWVVGRCVGSHPCS
jgi:hypothetical protein